MEFPRMGASLYAVTGFQVTTTKDHVVWPACCCLLLLLLPFFFAYPTKNVCSVVHIVYSTVNFDRTIIYAFRAATEHVECTGRGSLASRHVCWFQEWDPVWFSCNRRGVRLEQGRRKNLYLYAIWSHHTRLPEKLIPHQKILNTIWP